MGMAPRLNIPKNTQKHSTVEPALIHTPLWTAQAMGYGRLWVMRGDFWCRMMNWWPKKLWGITGYGFSQVRVKTGSTIMDLG